MLILLYFSTYPSEIMVPSSKISQADAIRIADADLAGRLDDYNGIRGIIDTSWSRYVPMDEFRGSNLKLPLVYVHPNDTLFMITDDGYQNRGVCNSGIYAYCGYLPHFSFNYGSRLVYGVEVLIESDEALAMYIIDASNGEIVDSTFLRREWVRAHSTEE